MTGEGGLGQRDPVLLVVVRMMKMSFTTDMPVPSGIISEGEVRRAGHIAVGMLQIGVAMISIRVPLMPTGVFLFGAAFCLLQLSAAVRHWIVTNRLTRVCLELWRHVGRLPFVLRVAILIALTLAGFALWLMISRSFLPSEFIINVLLCAGLILFIGPQQKSAEESTMLVSVPVE